MTFKSVSASHLTLQSHAPEHPRPSDYTPTTKKTHKNSYKKPPITRPFSPRPLYTTYRVVEVGELSVRSPK